MNIFFTAAVLVLGAFCVGLTPSAARGRIESNAAVSIPVPIQWVNVLSESPPPHLRGHLVYFQQPPLPIPPAYPKDAVGIPPTAVSANLPQAFFTLPRQAVYVQGPAHPVLTTTQKPTEETKETDTDEKKEEGKEENKGKENKGKEDKEKEDNEKEDKADKIEDGKDKDDGTEVDNEDDTKIVETTSKPKLQYKSV